MSKPSTRSPKRSEETITGIWEYHPRFDILELRRKGRGKIRTVETRPSVYVHKDESGALVGFSFTSLQRVIGVNPVHPLAVLVQKALRAEESARRSPWKLQPRGKKE